MAGSVNKVVLIGRVGKDPEIRTMQQNGKVASFSLATSESWKDKSSGDRKERTQWHSICVFNENIIKVVESYVKKGSMIYVEGALEHRKYEKDGRDVYVSEVVLRPYRGELTLLDSKGNDKKPGEAEHHGSSGRSAKPAEQFDEMEDSIPFMKVMGLA